MKISSKDKKILIYSDPHTEWRVVDEIVVKENPDVIICLGDYFDSHKEEGIGIKENREMAIWLRKQINNPKFVGLMGNHDLHYRYIHRMVRCSGYTDAKDSEINSILNHDHWEQLHYCAMVDDYILTHAGIHNYFIPNYLKTPDAIYEWLRNEIENGKKCLREGKMHWIYQVGYSRSGWAPAGGIFWCDANKEFLHSPNVRQLFGHTHQKTRKPREIYGSICIDTELESYITITNGKLEIKS